MDPTHLKLSSEAPSEPQSPQHQPSEASRSAIPSPWTIHHSKPRKWHFFRSKIWNDGDESDWWFAGTGIPLIAAAIGPLANVLSIAALVTSWRMCLVDNVNPAICTWDGDVSSLAAQLDGHPFDDPRWCYWLNAVSLICGFVGNIFLLFNFTGRVRYIIALPLTIFMWYVATGILIAITISMNVHVPPVRPQQTYTQGFWYGVLAAILYLISSMLLMVNMLGHFLGHYPSQFNLTDSQRTLILQTMMFFIWLAGGAGVFSRVESVYGDGSFDWTFANALYFCDATVLTVGFGDIYCTSDIGRGLVFPFSVGGIIMLGLVISSISKFAAELGSDKIIQRHVERSRARTFERSVTESFELERPRPSFVPGVRPSISAPFDPEDRTVTLRIKNDKVAEKKAAHDRSPPTFAGLHRAATSTIRTLTPGRANNKNSRLVLLREESDRFHAMRSIQARTNHFKQWTALSISVLAFGILWCVGAVVFWRAEQGSQDLSYFQALYFCYVSLLTIGYGDRSPRSNLGRPFFVLWSLIAVPTMTILVSDMGDTIITRFKKGTDSLADFTVLPKNGIWRGFLDQHPWLLSRIEGFKDAREAKRRLDRGFETGPGPETQSRRAPSIEEIAADKDTDEFELAGRLALAIRDTATDVKDGKQRYSYEEWVEFTRLIRFTKTEGDGDGVDGEERDRDLVDWDWIGEDSPMMARISEPEFVLDRLCESMGRYVRRLNPQKTERDVAGGSSASARQLERTSGDETWAEIRDKVD